MSTEDPKLPSQTGADATAAPRGSRPYRAPTLRRLGSVREVTWGAGSGFEGSARGMGQAKGMGKGGM